MLMRREPREFIDRESISVHLFCPICSDVLSSPTRTPCGHTFCLICIEKWLLINKRSRYCPECRQEIKAKGLDKDLLASKIINDLMVRCSNEQCDWRGKNGNYRKHKGECQYKTQLRVGEPINVITIIEEEPQQQKS